LTVGRIGSKTTSRPQRIKLVHEGTTLPPREFLDSKSSTVVDCDSELFVWIGKKSPVYQRKLAMLVAKMRARSGLHLVGRAC
jgi:hypothetical protein